MSQSLMNSKAERFLRSDIAKGISKDIPSSLQIGRYDSEFEQVIKESPNSSPSKEVKIAVGEIEGLANILDEIYEDGDLEEIDD